MAISFTFIFSFPNTATLELLKGAILFFVSSLSFLLPLESHNGYRMKVCRFYSISPPQRSQFFKPSVSFLHIRTRKFCHFDIMKCWFSLNPGFCSQQRKLVNILKASLSIFKTLGRYSFIGKLGQFTLIFCLFQHNTHRNPCSSPSSHWYNLKRSPRSYNNEYSNSLSVFHLSHSGI